jgi:hypothetical protein
MTLRSVTLTIAVCLPFALTLGCKGAASTAERGDTPPPVESTQLGRCAQGGGTVSDAASTAFFPRNVNDYCIDPNSETRAYGKSAPGTLDQVCTELFDGECEVYRAYGLERVVTVRYADAKGSTSTVNVVLSRFETPRGAYGFFTKRVVADSDPVETKTKPLAAGGTAALASTIAYVWRGAYVAELSYVNDSESPEALRQSAAKILPDIAKAIGGLLPGDVTLPDTAGLLPQDGLLPLGVLYEPHDVLGIQGVGPGSYGFYADQERRYRIVLMERSDEASAQDVLKTLKKVPGATELKTRPPVVSVTQRVGNEAAKLEWLFAREGNRVVGVGDEEFVANQASAEQARAKSLKHELKLEHLNKLVTSLKNRAAAAPRASGEASSNGMKKE